MEIITIRLDENQLRLAALVASSRHAQDVARAYKEAHGATGNSLDSGYVGCVGEIAVAKHYNLFWDGALGKLNAPDVGILQVRASALPNPSLLLHPKDKDKEPFISARVRGRDVDLLGWVYAFEGKKEEFWRTSTGRPAYFVRSLRPMSTLPLEPK